MKKKSAGWVRWAVLVAAVALIASFCRVTIVWDDAAEAGADANLSVAEKYCLDNWETKILPTIRERAADAATVLAAAKDDLDAAGEKYGARENKTSAWNFCLKGEAQVIGLENAEKASKTRLVIDLMPADGAPDALIQWSTVIKTNAIRDSVGFLKLDDFANQVEFAELTRAFNARVQQDLITKLSADSLVNKQISFVGCVALTKAGDAAIIEIIPIELSEVG